MTRQQTPDLADLDGALSCSIGSTSVSGTNRPPNSPK
jgi:hypothetical protein